MTRTTYPFLLGSVQIKNERNGSSVIFEPDELKALIEQLITLHRSIEHENTTVQARKRAITGRSH